MLRKFLVGLVVLCGGSVANAALLVNYSFNGANAASTWTPGVGDYGSTGTTPASFSQIMTAGAFTNNGTTGGIPGTINNSMWRTSTTIGTTFSNNWNELSLSPKTPIGDGVISIDSMTFKMGKTSGGNGNLINVRVDYRPSPTGTWVSIGTGASLGTTAMNPNTVSFASPVLITKTSASQSFRFLWTRTHVATGSNSGQINLEDVSFFGSFDTPTFVPEPASLAVFGSLAAFGLLGRYRRK